MAKVLGQLIYQSNAIVETRPTDGTVSAGDAVTWNGSGQLTPVSAESDEVYGVATEHTDVSNAGEKAPICVHGVIMGDVASGVTAGDQLVADGTNDGRLAASGAGGSVTVDEGGTSTHTIPVNPPQAASDAGGEYRGETADANVGAVVVS